MKNKLIDLNNHLFAQLERLGSEELTPEVMDLEKKRTKAMVEISVQIIDNARINLDAAELLAKHGSGQHTQLLPAIEGKNLLSVKEEVTVPKSNLPKMDFGNDQY